MMDRPSQIIEVGPAATHAQISACHPEAHRTSITAPPQYAFLIGAPATQIGGSARGYPPPIATLRHR
jgi:hypothetical protein